jgi:DNA helicase-2/ATP-dependent DNA helicase PcrA
LIEAMREATHGLPLPEAVEHVIAASGLLAHYKAEKDGQERLDNLEELVSAADSFLREADLAVDAPIATENEEPAATGGTDPLTAFLAHAALEAGETQAAEGQSALQLMTVHAAKGLEFHTVFVTGLEEGLFPHENSLSEHGGVEEERRLMYVALTRARRRLYLTQAQSRMLHGQVRYHVASRFLDEVPRELVQWLSPHRARARGALEFDAAEWGETRGASFAPANPPRAAANVRDERAGWRIGQSVRHAKFGLGIIVDAEGRGSDARVQVNFREAGVKWLALEYAKLEAA